MTSTIQVPTSLVFLLLLYDCFEWCSVLCQHYQSYISFTSPVPLYITPIVKGTNVMYYNILVCIILLYYCLGYGIATLSK